MRRQWTIAIGSVSLFSYFYALQPFGGGDSGRRTNARIPHSTISLEDHCRTKKEAIPKKAKYVV
jgi:hypothetical protein